MLRCQAPVGNGVCSKLAFWRVMPGLPNVCEAHKDFYGEDANGEAK